MNDQDMHSEHLSAPLSLLDLPPQLTATPSQSKCSSKMTEDCVK